MYFRKDEEMKKHLIAPSVHFSQVLTLSTNQFILANVTRKNLDYIISLHNDGNKL